MKINDDIIDDPVKPRTMTQRANSETKKLNTLIKENTEVLFETSSVFPFQLFPDKIIVDTNKVTIVNRSLFFKNITTILIRDLNNVQMTRGLLFASLTFDYRTFAQDPSPITHLWPKDALKAVNIITGLLSIKREEENVNYAKLPKDKVTKKVETIGKSTEDEKLF